jgi:Flp pilus assembly protein TadG
MLGRNNMKAAKNNRLNGESGQALIVTSLCIVLLTGFVGLCVDGGLLLRAKTNLQKVADAAAIAGAAEYTSGNWSAAAKAAAKQNGINCSATGITCNVSIGTTAHPSAVSVYLAQPQQTYFAGVFGYSTITVGAKAAAGIVSGSVCMYSLDTTATAPSGYGYLMNGGGNQTGIYAPACSVYDNANLRINGNHQLITAAAVGVAGSQSGNGSTSPAAVTGLLPVPDPLANYWTLPTFTASQGNLTRSSGSVSPGVYHNFNVTGTAILQPGLYVIQGTFNLNVASATGVTFFIDSAHGGSASCNGNGCDTVVGNLTAPPLGTGTSGSCSFAAGCNGLVFWDTETTTSNKTVGIGSTSVTGIIYAPHATLQINGSTTATFTTDIVAGAYLLNGDVNITNYAANAGAASPFHSAALLE